jgi:HSP20 family protein
MTSLIPWTWPTKSAIESWRQDLENMFERFSGEPFAGNGDAMKSWAPRVDVAETDKEFTVKADLPGVDPKDVDISVNGDTLTVRGEKKEEKEEKKKNYHRVERFEGKFFRQIGLPAGADADKVTAASAKGVITITIPKKPELQPKKIAVKAQD